MLLRLWQLGTNHLFSIIEGSLKKMSANVVCDIHDIIDAYKKYNAPEDIKEEILFFSPRTIL